MDISDQERIATFYATLPSYAAYDGKSFIFMLHKVYEEAGKTLKLMEIEG